MQFGSLKLKQCKHGWMLFGGPYIGECFDLYGEYSESEVALMGQLLNEGNTVIDVGASIGDLTVPLAKIVGVSGKVYAIESNPDAFNVLCANLALNSIRNTKPINAFIATSDKVDTAGPWGEFAYVSELWPTQFMSLDSLNLNACHLIKIDVDGKELEVLKSAQMLISKHRPVIYFENDNRDLSAPLLGYVLDLGYNLYWHAAPIFSPANFLGNPNNHWHPRNICSRMMLAIPGEANITVSNLRPVRDKNDWWQ